MLTDMARTEEELQEQSTPLGEVNKYPYGLSICLTEVELEKLGVDHEDWEVGGVLHLHALARITSISKNETEHGEKCRVELQLTHLDGESEDEEDKEYYSKERDEDYQPLAAHGYYRV